MNEDRCLSCGVFSSPAGQCAWTLCGPPKAEPIVQPVVQLSPQLSVLRTSSAVRIGSDASAFCTTLADRPCPQELGARGLSRWPSSIPVV